MLQLISVDSRDFTQPKLSLWLSDLQGIKALSLVFAFPALNRCVRIIKVMQVGHFKNLTLLYPSGAIGHQAWYRFSHYGWKLLCKIIFFIKRIAVPKCGAILKFLKYLWQDGISIIFQ